MPTRRILLAAAAVLLVVLAISAVALAADGPDLSWWLIGGGSPIAAGSVSLSGGVGQAVAGVVATGSTSLCSGFWCVPGVGPPPPNYPVYLPLVVR